ncbi:hypothetical protein BJ684DRAFT_19990 [Piptocephalis cylindrospora]|uniref:Uncharacterized protein n=1 Tax=Piptocephalis cylindrospora TaxID=1907219 RepID=A0A4P9Y4E7_9FUNG|nr:hypothetical protein BJ684DRAFT_19990 [Piptocephalis cylindrospora]|eukprot:RKP13532.1 hypothetical protein BJ684DRAFT_19990 [Piptocephalis cylindrospora]
MRIFLLLSLTFPLLHASPIIEGKGSANDRRHPHDHLSIIRHSTPTSPTTHLHKSPDHYPQKSPGSYSQKGPGSYSRRHFGSHHKSRLGTGGSTNPLDPSKAEKYRSCVAYARKNGLLSEPQLPLNHPSGYPDALHHGQAVFYAIQDTLYHIPSLLLKHQHDHQGLDTLKKRVAFWVDSTEQPHEPSSFTEATSSASGSITQSCWEYKNKEIGPVSLVPLPTKGNAWVRNIAAYLNAYFRNPEIFLRPLDITYMDNTPFLVTEMAGQSLEQKFKENAVNRDKNRGQAGESRQNSGTDHLDRIIRFSQDFQDHMGYLEDIKKLKMEDWGFGIQNIHQQPTGKYKFSPSTQPLGPKRKSDDKYDSNMRVRISNLAASIILETHLKFEKTHEGLLKAVNPLGVEDRQSMMNALSGTGEMGIRGTMKYLAKKYSPSRTFSGEHMAKYTEFGYGLRRGSGPSSLKVSKIVKSASENLATMHRKPTPKREETLLFKVSQGAGDLLRSASTTALALTSPWRRDSSGSSASSSSSDSYFNLESPSFERFQNSDPIPPSPLSDGNFQQRPASMEIAPHRSLSAQLQHIPSSFEDKIEGGLGYSNHQNLKPQSPPEKSLHHNDPFHRDPIIW